MRDFGRRLQRLEAQAPVGPARPAWDALANGDAAAWVASLPDPVPPAPAENWLARRLRAAEAEAVAYERRWRADGAGGLCEGK